MIKEFIKDCLLFQSKNYDNKLIGVFFWGMILSNIFNFIILCLK